ncbi:MAG: hypothetical protein PHC61_03940 [Chitinivibrionales bacterium]|nr:hypothetical protein [Chitinivibrionales bacterium]
MPAPRIVHSIQKHRVLISTNDRDTFELSSGTLVRIANKSFVFTAQHNLSHLAQRKFFLNLGIPYQDCFFMVKKIWSDESLDISYIELDTDAVEKYRRGIEPVVLGKKVPSMQLAPKYRAAAILGYPFANVHLDGQSKTYGVETVYILSQLVKSENWPSGIDKDKSQCMLIEYGQRHGQTFIDQNGAPVSTPLHPGGLSGSAIWKFNPETMDHENPEYAFWGIQNCWFPGQQVLCGTYIEPLIKKIASDYGFGF